MNIRQRLMTTTVMKKRTRVPLPFQILLWLSFAVVGGNAQPLDSLSKSQRFEMILSESHYKIEADLQNHTKTFYDTLGYDSIVQKYYPNEQLYKQSNYLNGKLHGKIVTFHSNGVMESEEHYELGTCTDSQFISYDMFGLVEFESWKIRFRGRLFTCATHYNNGCLSGVQIFDSRNPQVVYAGFMWVDGEWKTRNHHYQNSPHAYQVLKRYNKEYTKRHPSFRSSLLYCP